MAMPARCPTARRPRHSSTPKCNVSSSRPTIQRRGSSRTTATRLTRCPTPWSKRKRSKKTRSSASPGCSARRGLKVFQSRSPPRRTASADLAELCRHGRCERHLGQPARLPDSGSLVMRSIIMSTTDGVRFSRVVTDAVGWGVALWLIGYVLGIILFFFSSNNDYWLVDHASWRGHHAVGAAAQDQLRLGLAVRGPEHRVDPHCSRLRLYVHRQSV